MRIVATYSIKNGEQVVRRKYPALLEEIESAITTVEGDRMSSGVSYFEQFAWDLKTRGVADIDIPVLILGIDY